jgi:hypothetical protein
MMRDCVSDMSAFEHAFGVLTTPALPELTKQILVFIALNVDYGANEHVAALRELFARYSQVAVMNCLDAILTVALDSERERL